MSTFRIYAKNFAITFPATVRLPFDKDELLSHLASIDSPTYTLVCEELHQTGVPHFHALISYSTKKNVRNPRYFDFMGAHANVQGCKHLANWIAYVKKDGNFVERGEPPTNPSTNRDTLNAADFSSEECWLRAAMAADMPPAYAMRFWAIHKQEEENGILTIPEGYTTNPAAQVCQALQNFIPADLEHKSLVLIGPSGCGKTTFAKQFATKPALFVRHIDDLRKIKSTHRSIIFDDIDFRHWPRTSQIHLVDKYDASSVHLRYTTALLAPSIQRIFTGNDEMLSLQDPAIRRRCRVYRIAGLGQDFQRSSTGSDTDDTTLLR